MATYTFTEPFSGTEKKVVATSFDKAVTKLFGDVKREWTDMFDCEIDGVWWRLDIKFNRCEKEGFKKKGRSKCSL